MGNLAATVALVGSWPLAQTETGVILDGWLVPQALSPIPSASASDQVQANPPELL